METVQLLDHTFEIYVDNALICEATKQVAQKINADYANAGKPPVLLITLSGAMMFAAELVKHLTIDHKWAFIKCSSYRDEMRCGQIKLKVEPTSDIKGENVIVIEDIVDSGNTWKFLHDYCLEKGATSVDIATMSIKEAVYNKDLPVKYCALKLENIFVVGFGLDYAQKGRNLPHIYKVID